MSCPCCISVYPAYPKREKYCSVPIASVSHLHVITFYVMLNKTPPKKTQKRKKKKNNKEKFYMYLKEVKMEKEGSFRWQLRTPILSACGIKSKWFLWKTKTNDVWLIMPHLTSMSLCFCGHLSKEEGNWNPPLRFLCKAGTVCGRLEPSLSWIPIFGSL